MDPAQYQQILNYTQRNPKIQVSLNSGGNVVMLPVVQMGEATSPTDSLSQHVTTHIITSEQVLVVSRHLHHTGWPTDFSKRHSILSWIVSHNHTLIRERFWYGVVSRARPFT